MVAGQPESGTVVVMQPLPTFFLVGAPKAGSTSLHHYLGQHPDICMSLIKEPHYLSEEIRIEKFEDNMRVRAESRAAETRAWLRGPDNSKFSGGPIVEWDDYVRLFRHATNEKAIGESSVCYLWSKTAPSNIAARFPDARILIMLRNPVERAFAQYVHAMSMAKAPFSFPNYLDRAFASPRTGISEVHPFLEFGLYHEQLRRYLSLFPRGQIGIFFYEGFQRDPRGTLRGIFHFLGVDDSFVPDMSQRHMVANVPRSFGLNRIVRKTGLWGTARRTLPSSVLESLKRLATKPRRSLRMQPSERARLIEYYRHDIESLSRFLDRDLSAWLN
jgi:hypothetical protein